MGIRGLYSFMRRNNVSKAVDLAVDIPEDQKCLVFDGEALLYKLYVFSAHWGVGLNVSWVHGGQTLHWYHLVRNFFEVFLRRGIRVIVIMDGSKEVAKVATMQSRQRERAAAIIRCLRGREKQDFHNPAMPLNTKKVFMEAVRELAAQYPPLGDGLQRVHMSCALFEADPVVVEACRSGDVYGIIASDTDFIAMLPSVQAAYEDTELVYIHMDSLMVTEDGHITADVYPVQTVPNLLGLQMDQMALLGSLVENDYLKHAQHLQEFHYRIGVLRHPMDTTVSVGKYLKEGGSEDPDAIFMGETDLTIRGVLAAKLHYSVLQYNRPRQDTMFRLRGAELTDKLAAQLAEQPEEPDYNDHDYARLLLKNGLLDFFRDGIVDATVGQILWDLSEMRKRRTPQRPVTYRTPPTLNDWISRGKNPNVMLWPLRRRLVEMTLSIAPDAPADEEPLKFRDNLLGDRIVSVVRPIELTPAAGAREMLVDELKGAFFAEGSAKSLFTDLSAKLLDGAMGAFSDTQFAGICSVVAVMAAGCHSRLHFFAPLSFADTMFFVRCYFVSLVLRSGRTSRPEEELGDLAMRVPKRLGPNSLCMTTLIETVNTAFHHLDSICMTRSVKSTASGGSEAPLPIEWADSVDGRLAHAVMNISLENDEMGTGDDVDPSKLLNAHAPHTAMMELLNGLPWEDLFRCNWGGDVATFVPSAEKGDIIQLNDEQLDVWDRQLVMDAEGDSAAGAQGPGGGGDDEEEARDDESLSENEDDDEEEEEEEEDDDNAYGAGTMEEKRWDDWGEEDVEAVNLAAPSNNDFLTLRQLQEQTDYTKIEWVSIIRNDQWGDEVDEDKISALAQANGGIESIDDAYQKLDPPTAGGADSEFANRVTQTVRPSGPWQKHLGGKQEISLEISRAWADISESVPPMPKKDRDEFKTGILTSVSAGSAKGVTMYRAESTWRPPQRGKRNNFQKEFKPDTFSFEGPHNKEALVGCKFDVMLCAHPMNPNIKMAVYGSLDITKKAKELPKKAAELKGESKSSASGLDSLTDSDRMQAKNDGIYDSLMQRAKQMRPGRGDTYAVTTNERAKNEITIWEEQVVVAKAGWHPHEFQVEAFKLIRNSRSVLVTAPTGAGKTEVAMCAINQALIDEERVIFICPTKALVNQTVLTILAYFQEYPDWQKKKPDDRLCGFNYMDANGKVNTSAQIVVTVPQTLHLMLKGAENKALNDVGWIILDEVHHIQEKGSGMYWDWIFRLAERDQTKFVALSATLASNRDFAAWLGSFRKKEFTFVKEGYVKPQEPGEIARVHGSHIDVFPDGRPVKQQIFVFDRDFVKLPRRGVIAEDNYRLPFNIALSAEESSKQNRFIEEDAHCSITYDQQKHGEVTAAGYESSGDDDDDDASSTTSTMSRASTSAGRAEAPADTPTAKWDALKKATGILGKTILTGKQAGAVKKAVRSTVRALENVVELLRGFLGTAMATKAADTRTLSSADVCATFISAVYLLTRIEAVVPDEVAETHELLWEALTTYPTLKMLYIKVVAQVEDVAQSSDVMEHLVVHTLRPLASAIISMNSPFDESLRRTPNWLADSDEEEEEEDELMQNPALGGESPRACMHLMRALSLPHIRTIVKSLGNELCQTYPDIKKHSVFLTSVLQKLLEKMPKTMSAAVVFICLDTISRFTQPPESVTHIFESALANCLKNKQLLAVAETVSQCAAGGKSNAVVLEICAKVVDAGEGETDPSSMMAKLTKSTKAFKKQLIALACFPHIMSPKDVATLRKTFAKLTAPAEDESDEDEEDEADDEDRLAQACMLLYRLLFTRCAVGQLPTADLRADTLECVTSFLLIFEKLEHKESWEMLVLALQHTLSLLDGHQMISVAEKKESVFTLLPGLRESYPTVGSDTNSPAAQVKALQYLMVAAGLTTGAEEQLKITGVFDAPTAKLIAALQKDQGIDEEGRVKEMTWQCLLGPIKYGYVGIPVLALRELLPEPEAAAKAQVFDPQLRRGLWSCLAANGATKNNNIDERTWLMLFLRANYANNGREGGKEYNKEMRMRMKKAQILFKTGLGVPLLGAVRERMLWAVRCTYEGTYEGTPVFNGKQWEITKYRTAKDFGILEAELEVKAFATSLLPHKTFPEERPKPRESLALVEDVAVEVLSARSECNTNFDRRAFEKLVYDIPNVIQTDVNNERKLVLVLRIIAAISGANSKGGTFLLPPHVVLTLVEVMHEFPAPTAKQERDEVTKLCGVLLTRWYEMRLNPYVINTLEAEFSIIKQKMSGVVNVEQGPPDASTDELFVRNWLFSTRSMGDLMSYFIGKAKKGRAAKVKELLPALARIVRVLSFVTGDADMNISRKCLSSCFYLISCADRLMRRDIMLNKLSEEIKTEAHALHRCWCRNPRMNSQMRIFLVSVFRLHRAPDKKRKIEALSDEQQEDIHMYLHWHQNESLYDLRCLHMHEITGLQHYRELVVALRDKSMLPALMFCLDKRRVEKIARHLAFQDGLLEVPEASQKAIDAVLPALAFAEPTGQSLGLFDMLRKGIGVHHADLSSQWRMEIEQLFRSRHLHLVVATGTLAVGIHMPCKTVVFCGDNEKHLSIANFQQMAGRAGRQGIIMPAGDPPMLDVPELKEFGAVTDEGKAEDGIVILFGAFSKERVEVLMTHKPTMEPMRFFTTNSVLDLLHLSNPREEGTKGYERGLLAIESRSAYEYLCLRKESAVVGKKQDVKFDADDSSVARLKQQQLIAAFSNLRMMGMLDKNFEPSLAVAVVQRMHLLDDPENLIFAQALPYVAHHILEIETPEERIDTLLNMMLYFFPEPRPYTRADMALDWTPQLKPLPAGVVELVNMYNLENILNIMELTKKPFDKPPNARVLTPPLPQAARALTEQEPIGLHPKLAAEKLTVTYFDAEQQLAQLEEALGKEEIDAKEYTAKRRLINWYRPPTSAGAMSGHCDGYIEHISYYSFIENNALATCVNARAGRENVYKTLQWEGPFKAHVREFLLSEFSSMDICSRLNLAMSDLHQDLNGVSNVTRKLQQALQDLWQMLPPDSNNDGKKFERWFINGGGNVLEERARTYVYTFCNFLYDGLAATKQPVAAAYEPQLKAFKGEVLIKARNIGGSLLSRLWAFLADCEAETIRVAQKRQAGVKEVIQRYNRWLKEGRAGGGRVKAYQREVVENLVIWLSYGANCESAEDLLDLFITHVSFKLYAADKTVNVPMMAKLAAEEERKGEEPRSDEYKAKELRRALREQWDELAPAEREMYQEKSCAKPELRPLGLKFAEYMYAQRPKATWTEIQHTKLLVSQSCAEAKMTSFATHLWGTVETKRVRLYRNLDDTLRQQIPRPKLARGESEAETAIKREKQRDAVRLSFARWLVRQGGDDAAFDHVVLTEGDVELRATLGAALASSFTAIWDDVKGDSTLMSDILLAAEFEVQKDTFQQAGGWLRGNRAGIEMLIDTSKQLNALIVTRVAEDRERQSSKFGKVKPLWVIETEAKDANAMTEDDVLSDKMAAREDAGGSRNKRGGDD